MKRIGQGRTADIFEYKEDQILKLYNKEFSEDAIRQEFEISSAAYSLGIQTPRPFQLTEAENRRGILFERIPGSTLLHNMTKKPWLMPKHSGTLAALHAELHTHDAPGLLRQQKSLLSHSIKSTLLLTEKEKNKILAHLDELPDGNKLCHGDFHPDNVMMNQSPIIIDWMNGMSGNPAGDAARTIILITCGTMPEGTPIVLTVLINALRKWMKTAYMKEYLRLTGLNYTDIDKWILPVAAARLMEESPKAEQDKLVGLIRDRLRGISSASDLEQEQHE
ncbi:phosphotransferase [Paenibacillus lutrae]|uniref:Phosphotransferase n=1 Tax=Paenibacillus lutrae TaxID=2078573 RepID=A0A7X3FHE8_9BACL|nr:phosphotransferase [Paenibacillus lutrae]MVO99538.1 phosphotransferase [Paenibacillus lutrae]